MRRWHLLGICLAVPVALGAERAGGLKEGKPDLKSAGPLAFGPDGILFVGDTAGAALFAIDTGEKAEAKEKAQISRSRTYRARSPGCWARRRSSS